MEAIRAATGSFGGGGRGDLIFPAPLGGGARLTVFGFGVAACPPVRPAAESMPVPLVDLCFTLILMVSPSYRPNNKHTILNTGKSHHDPGGKKNILLRQ